jgi:hypothetical protein
MLILIYNMIQEIKMTDLEKEIKENLGKYIETPWAVIESYFKDQHLAQLVRHQLNLIMIL